jgi:hypothetical protein
MDAGQASGAFKKMAGEGQRHNEIVVSTNLIRQKAENAGASWD